MLGNFGVCAWRNFWGLVEPCWSLLGCVQGDLARGPAGSGIQGGDIRGCAGGCERGLCGAVLGLGPGGSPSRDGWCREGTAGSPGDRAALARHRCPQPAAGAPSLHRSCPGVGPCPCSPPRLRRGAGLRPAVRGPAGQTLPSGTRVASAPAVHHGAASPSPCPQLCRHDPAGGGSEKTRGKKRLLEGLELRWWAGGGQFAPSLKPTPLLAALSMPAPACSVPGPPMAPAGPDPARGCSLGHGAVFPRQTLLNPTTPRHRGARPR